MNPIIIRLDAGKTVDRFKVTKMLGEGTFGAVYAVDDGAGNSYALKSESVNEKVPLLKLELAVMLKLQERKSRHMADLIDKGRFENFNYIVMKFLGKSLQDAKKEGPDNHLTLGCAISVAIQCLEALEELHWCGFLHRDVKPGNFAVGRTELGETRKIYVLDFGMCRKYVNAQNVILPPRKKTAFRGTPRYAAIASHDGKEHGRKHDVESWFYMLVDFTNAKLPWKTIVDLKEVGDCKRKSRDESALDEFFTLGSKEHYTTILRHIDGLGFYDEPNYEMIYETLRTTIKVKNATEFPYDWEEKK